MSEMRINVPRNSSGWSVLYSRIARVITVVLVFFFPACTHTITHLPAVADRRGDGGAIVLVIPPEVSDKVVEQRLGINVDLWRIAVGSAITELLPQTLGSTFASVRVEISDSRDEAARSSCCGNGYLRIHSVDSWIKMGGAASGSPEIAVTVEAEFIDVRGLPIFRREFSALGHQSGADQLQSWQDSYQFNSYGKGVDRALGNALTEAVLNLSQAITTEMKKHFPQG